MNKKGQALVEFVLVMPIFMILIMSIIDVGNIFIKKYELNNDIELIENMYQNKDTQRIVAYTSNKNIVLEENTNSDLTTIKLKKEIKINAPILNKIIGKKYIIETDKTFYKDNEQ